MKTVLKVEHGIGYKRQRELVLGDSLNKEILISLLAITISIMALVGVLLTPKPVFPMPQYGTNHQYIEERNILSTTGSGRVLVEPDVVSIILAVEVEKPTAGEAISEAADIMNKVIESLLKIGVNRENIATTGFSLYPVYEYIDRKTVLRGYRVVNRITVKVPTAEQAGEVIDTAVNSGANRVDSITFELSPEKYKSAYQRALSLAVEEARRKAETVASAAGVEIVKILKIDIQQPYYTPIKYEVAETARTPIIEGELTVTAQVTIIFEIKN